MDAQAVTIRSVRNTNGKQAVVALVFPMCLAVLTLGVAAAGLLLWRRLSGAMSLPVSQSTLAVTGLIMAGYLMALRGSWFSFAGSGGAGLGVARFSVAGDDSQRARPFSMPDLCVIAIPTLSVIAVAASLSIPQTNALGLLLLWSFPLATELAVFLGVSRWAHPAQLPPSRLHPVQVTPAQPETDERLHLTDPPTPPNNPLDFQDEPSPEIPSDDPNFRFDPPHETPPPHWPDEDVSQQLTRRRTSEGIDSMHLWVRADVPSGSRVGVAHLAFCPPFDDTPEVLFEQADGPEATIKLGQVLPYGARLEWKLEAVSESDESILIEVFVQDTNTVAASGL